MSAGYFIKDTEAENYHIPVKLYFKFVKEHIIYDITNTEEVLPFSQHIMYYKQKASKGVQCTTHEHWGQKYICSKENFIELNLHIVDRKFILIVCIEA